MTAAREAEQAAVIARNEAALKRAEANPAAVADRMVVDYARWHVAAEAGPLWAALRAWEDEGNNEGWPAWSRYLVEYLVLVRTDPDGAYWFWTGRERAIRAGSPLATIWADRSRRILIASRPHAGTPDAARAELVASLWETLAKPRTRSGVRFLTRVVEALAPAYAPNLDGDRARIIPSKIAILDAAEGDKRAARFSPPVRSGDQLRLFEWEHAAPALPLNLYELGQERGAPGPGAALALRTIVEAIAATNRLQRLAEPGKPWPVELTVRYFLRRLWPNRWPKPGVWRAMIDRVRVVLASEAAAIAWDDGVLRNPVLMGSWPKNLDDPVQLIINLPPGCENGPQISDRLHLYGPQHGRHYRTLLNLAYWWHEPGRTMMPIDGTDTMIRVFDPKRYRTMSEREKLSITFPRYTERKRRTLASEADRVLGDLVRDGEARVVDGKLLPPPKQPPLTLPPLGGSPDRARRKTRSKP